MRCGCSAPTAEREADLGEALTGAANGVVTAEAKAAFERALQLDADDFQARYFIGLAAEQDGRPKEAAAIWRELLAGAPADAPWIGRWSANRWRASIPNAAPPPHGPERRTTSRPRSELSPEQRAEMVRGMVERLAERLKHDGSDVEGWLRLVRAYMVLGERDKARAAAADARRALGGEPTSCGGSTNWSRDSGSKG